MTHRAPIAKAALVSLLILVPASGRGAPVESQEPGALPPSLRGWIGPLNVSRQLARAKADALGRMRAKPAVVTANQAALDFHYYDLVLHPDPVSSVLTGSVRALATVIAGPLATMQLDFGSATMTVDAVSCAGHPATFTHASDLLTINLDRSYATGELVDVTVAYHGTPQTGGFGGAFTFFTHDGSPLVTTLSEPFDARQWWPCKDDPSDKADSVDVRVTVPTGMITASNGVLVESTDNGITAFRHWKTRHAIATYLVSIASFPYSTSSDTYQPASGGPMPIQFYMFPEDLSPAAAVNTKVKSMIGAFALEFGEYPFADEKYGEAEFTWGGGMENQTCTSLGAFSESIVAHELSHEWFGDAVTCRDFHHIWLNEGFATYCEALWAENQGGAAGYAGSMNARRYLGAGTIYVPDLTDVNRIFDDNLSYGKAAWVLHMLRHVMGDASFFTALKTYEQQFAQGTAVTEDFEAVCQSVSGLDLSRFFQQWIYGEYYPQYRAVWSSLPQGGGYDVTLQLQQTQSWQRFAMPVDVRIQTSAGPQNFVANDSLAVQYFTFHVATPPSSVTIDPDGWILQTTSYPTAVVEADRVSALSLGLVWPNPASGPTSLSFALPKAGHARLALYDAAGRRVASLVDEPLAAGEHTVRWSGRLDSGAVAPAGVYELSLRLDGAAVTRRLVVSR